MVEIIGWEIHCIHGRFFFNKHIEHNTFIIVNLKLCNVPKEITKSKSDEVYLIEIEDKGEDLRTINNKRLCKLLSAGLLALNVRTKGKQTDYTIKTWQIQIEIVNTSFKL